MLRVLPFVEDPDLSVSPTPPNPATLAPLGYKVQVRPPSVPLLFVPQEYHSQAGLANTGTGMYYMQISYCHGHQSTCMKTCLRTVFVVKSWFCVFCMVYILIVQIPN